MAMHLAESFVTRTATSLLVALGLSSGPLGAQESCVEDAMIVFDGSGSMSETGFNLLEEPRIHEARRAMRRAMPPIAANRNLGLIIYGPGPGDICSNIEMHFGPSPNAAPAIISAVDALVPSGNTALTEAVREAAEALDYTQNPGTIVLITDGKETCGGSPCELASTLVADAQSLTVHVIGFRVRGDHFSWDTSSQADDYANATTVARCLADRTGGSYVAAEGVDELIAALRDTLGCQLIGALK